MSKFIKIGDGRLQIFLSEDRAGGLVLRFSGTEAQQAWDTLCDPARVEVTDTAARPSEP